MSASERRKGKEGELQVARILRAAGIDCQRKREGSQTGDFELAVPGVYLNAKFHETLRLPTWLREAEHEAREGDTPVVAFKTGGRWYAALPLAEYAETLELAQRGAVKTMWNAA